MINPYNTGSLIMNQMASYQMSSNLRAPQQLQGQQVAMQRVQQTLQGGPQAQMAGRATYLGIMGQDFLDNGIMDGSSLATWAQETGVMDPAVAAYSMQYEMQLDKADDGRLNGSHLVSGMTYGAYGTPLNLGYLA